MASDLRKKAVGILVFPRITKAGFLFGGAGVAGHVLGVLFHVVHFFVRNYAAQIDGTRFSRVVVFIVID